jgi:L-lactate dehydrogenase
MKIGIVGAGQVGATAAYSMMMRRVGSGILLVDHNADLAVAQARDILDATPFADPVRVRAGEFADLDGARLVVLAAGTSQRPGESRLDLLSRNAEIFAGSPKMAGPRREHQPLGVTARWLQPCHNKI